MTLTNKQNLWHFHVFSCQFLAQLDDIVTFSWIEWAFSHLFLYFFHRCFPAIIHYRTKGQKFKVFHLLNCSVDKWPPLLSNGEISREYPPLSCQGGTFQQDQHGCQNLLASGGYYWQCYGRFVKHTTGVMTHVWFRKCKILLSLNCNHDLLATWRF